MSELLTGSDDPARAAASRSGADRGPAPGRAEKSTWRAGVVVHPARDIDGPLEELMRWAGEHEVELVQIPVAGQDREVAELGVPADCDLIISIGGDGTMLAATRAAVSADRPVLGVACGSLGALTTVAVGGIGVALDRFSGGDWVARELPALRIVREGEDELFALNDLAVVRDGIGQVRTSASVDGVLYCRLAGDGCIVSTQVGSSAYTIAAGGPLLAPGALGFVLTPLSTHGGACPPLIVGSESELALDIAVGHDGARLEVDGQIVGPHLGLLRIGLRPAVATLVSFDDQEPLLTGLRRRWIIADSPRILAEGDAAEGAR